MGEKGSPHGHFQRAVERGHLLSALAAARQLGTLRLGDALALTLLLAAEDARDFERAAVRWQGRFALEAKGVTLHDLLLAVACLSALRGRTRELSAETLLQLAQRYGVPVLRPAGAAPASASSRRGLAS